MAYRDAETGERGFGNGDSEVEHKGEYSGTYRLDLADEQGETRRGCSKGVGNENGRGTEIDRTDVERTIKNPQKYNNGGAEDNEDNDKQRMEVRSPRTWARS